MDKKDIAFVQFIIESHEGLAVVRTVDPDAGVIELLVAPDFEEDVEYVVSALKKYAKMEELKLRDLPENWDSLADGGNEGEG